MSEVGTFAAAIRTAETGSSRGDYARVHGRVRQGRLIGAYGFPSDEWQLMASEAGLAGARWGDPRAQDVVARRMFEALYAKYGDWRLVAVAWKAGEEVADRVAADPSLLNAEPMKAVKEYVRQVMSHAQDEIAVNLPADDDGNQIRPDRFQPTMRGLEATSPQAGGQSSAGDTLRGVLVALRDHQRTRAAAAEPAEAETDIRMSESDQPQPAEGRSLFDRVRGR